MTDTQTWLTQSAYDRLNAELSELLRQRSDDAVAPAAREAHARDSADQNTGQQILAVRRERDGRIRKLQELLQNPIVGQQRPNDGIAEPGMLLTIRYEDDQETETFLLAHSEDGAYPADLMICSPDSPLGLVLPGMAEGDSRRYALPDGTIMEITLLRATPYGIDAPQLLEQPSPA